MPDKDTNVFGEVGGTDIGEVSDQTVSPAEKQATGQEGQTQDQDLPFHEHPRWKEVYGKAQKVEALEQELTNLKNQFAQVQGRSLNQNQPEWEPKTWQEVLQKSVEATVSRLQQAQSEQQQQIVAEDQALAGALSQLKGQVGEFDERKLLEFCYNHKIGDVSVGYELMKKIDAAEKTGEKHALRKKVAPIGSSSKTEGGAKQSTPYQSLHKRSLEDIVSDAAERIS